MHCSYIITVAVLNKECKEKVSFNLKRQVVIIISSLAIMITIGLSIDMYLTHKEIMEANLNGNPIVHKEGLISNWSFTCDGL